MAKCMKKYITELIELLITGTKLIYLFFICWYSHSTTEYISLLIYTIDISKHFSNVLDSLNIITLHYWVNHF